MRTHVPFDDAPVTMRVELRADAPLQQQRRRRLLHLALDLRRVVLLFGAVRGEHAQLVVRVRRRAPGERRLQQALRDEIREAPVRRGRMRVILHRQAEVPFRAGRPATRRAYSPEPSSFTTASERSAKPRRVGRPAREEERVQRDGIRRGGQRVTEPGGEIDDPLPAFRRSQHPAQRRKPAAARGTSPSRRWPRS